MRTRLALLLTATCAALALGGCGDDEPDEVTIAEWTAAADTICADAQTKVDALGPLPAGNQAALPKWAADGIAIRSEQMTKLKALEEPKDKADEINATLAKADALLASAQTTLANAKDGIPFVALAELQTQQGVIQNELAAYGPTKCAPKTS